MADIARQVAVQRRAQWRFAVEDEGGEMVAAGTTRRRPNASQRRQIEAVHRTCVFPGCRIPASSSDLDHIRPFGEGGPTYVENLAPLCRHDHRVRHEAGWTYRRLTGGGFEWTSKLGLVYARPGVYD